MGQRRHDQKNFKYFEMNGNENMTHENLGGADKIMLNGKILALNLCVRKELKKKTKNNDPSIFSQKARKKNRQLNTKNAENKLIAGIKVKKLM